MRNTDKPKNKIRISAGPVTAEAELDSSKTAQAIWQALPLSSTAQRWGDEVYFSIPVTLEAENQRGVVEAGDLGYWPPGSAFCIFFGRTPASRGDEIRPAQPGECLWQAHWLPRGVPEGQRRQPDKGGEIG